MYRAYFGLSETPFAITPDPRFVYLSERHQDALAHLLYGVGRGGGGGFVAVTGDIGTGKTTLCRLLLEQLPAGTRAALVLNPKLSALELIASILDELGVDYPEPPNSTKTLIDRLNAYLLEAHGQGLSVVVIFDEAQNLSADALEQIRLLTNLETPTAKLLQIVLLGQPELRRVLERGDLHQLAQRITARYHLRPLVQRETAEYVRHRLAVAGAQYCPFTAGALRALHRRAGGVPRLINVIADRSLLAAYTDELAWIGPRLVERAADEVQGVSRRRRRRRVAAAGLAAAAAASLALAMLVPPRFGSHPAENSGAVPSSAQTTDPTPSDGSDDAPTRADPGRTDTGAHPAQARAAPPPAPAGTAEPAASPEPESPRAATGDGSGAKSPLAHALADASPAATRRAAWEGLLRLWDREPTTVGWRSLDIACENATPPGLRCVRQHGNLRRLRALGRPAVLALDGEDTHAVLLKSLGNNSAQLVVGETDLAVTHATLDAHWLGTFYAAYAVPASAPATLSRGQAGEAVAWARSLAERAAGDGPTVAGEGPYDASLAGWVRAFQRRHQLRVDGILGPSTQLWLTAEARTPPNPTLAPTAAHEHR